jgi:hypothetical protein
MIGGLEHVLAKVLKPKHIEFGAGLKAAQIVFARMSSEQDKAVAKS